ncbi:MAG: BMP family ABC transporter substrate-binding protein [Eubacteriales bacterium]|nr:BMP family ABC transporter substrate-binding protein [Eubacteriales bacterium]
MTPFVFESYQKALKAGLKECHTASSKHENPYPETLDVILEGKKTAGLEEMGIQSIPLDLIVGTKTAGRQNAFSRSFLPLFDEGSEFAAKWMNLMESQMEEGIHDPIKVYEYMNRYYVLEGNKRVSVLKYLEAAVIEGYVTRILPEYSEDPKVQLYYEYVDFQRNSGIFNLHLSEKGDYKKLLLVLGKEKERAWTPEEREEFQILLKRFTYQYEKNVKEKAKKQKGDAFLIYLNIFSYEEACKKDTTQIAADIKKMKKEFLLARGEEVEDVIDPEEKKGNLWDKLFAANKVKVAFLYDREPETSSWLLCHELGRRHLKSVWKTGIAFEKFICSPDSQYMEDIEAIIKDGFNVIFATTPILQPKCLKAALEHPEVQIFSCAARSTWKSIRGYYVRVYEQKFLIGLIAGALSKDKEICYEADYPIYATIANANAFALGVSMTNPTAKVRLVWASRKEEFKEPINEDTSIISNRNMITAEGVNRRFGLYTKEEGAIRNIATGIIDWGLIYEKIIRQMMDGTWKKISDKEKKAINYWWGLSTGVVNVVCSSSMPKGVQKMVNHYKQAIADGSFHPFEGEFYDQDGQLHGEEGKTLSNEEIITMDWLNENIVGSIPNVNELNDKAYQMVKLQGLEKMKGE